MADADSPEVIFFDAHGTLLHLAEPVGVTYTRIAGEFGLQADAKTADSSFRRAWRNAASPLYPDGPSEEVDRLWWKGIVFETLKASATRWPEDFPFDECYFQIWSHYARGAAWRLFPDARPCLDRLQGNYLLGVLSNFDRRLLGVLKDLDAIDFFDFIVLSSESAAPKPDPAIFQRAARLAGAAPQACLLVGDDPVRDKAGAEAAGFQCVLLDRPSVGLAEALGRLCC